ncbi:hypothetical protein DL98DRAFT_363592, partial [Cadophora sp. DSE1049]
ELYADLRPYTFGESPEYECISYCWGPREGSMHLIVLNGRQHYVPTNVHDILHRRSSFLRPSCIWIDSICIDQLNLEEKNHQVPMMRSIYEKASHIYVCLGEDR